MKISCKFCVFILMGFLAETGLAREVLKERSKASVLYENVWEGKEFRRQDLKPELYEKILDSARKPEKFSDILTATMLHGNFHPEEVIPDKRIFWKYKSEEYRILRECYQAVWEDIQYFPVPERQIYYEDTYGEARAYGGQRVHEGCDLFGEKTEPGYYPILSMTDGIVENVGWLPLGGYRIGIRAPQGGYFYYAHLSGYEKEFQEGETVKAGDILGYMGNTGYGKEGTTGMFPVHLHLGIYIRTPHCEEMSVDPYRVLQAISKKIRNFAY